jgi:prophage maintenance system killer protein
MSGPDSQVVIYKTPGGSVSLDVKLQGETVWLSLNHMAELFARDKSVISRHLTNVYNTGELRRNSTVAFFAIVQDEGGRQVERRIEFYNLDAILSVGYRVNSKRGTQFRIWATRVLREHLIRGYSINERRLKELNQAIRLIADVAERRTLTGEEATSLLRVVADYSFALNLLDAYDRQAVGPAVGTRGPVKGINLEEARNTVERLREHYGAGTLFGRERDKSLASSLQTVFQTFGGKDLYPTLEEKAAHLLYFLVKNHPFVDGNKRIAATLFLWFLEKNAALYRPEGIKRIADNALVAMTLLIAESRAQEKDLLTRVLVHLIHSEKP